MSRSSPTSSTPSTPPNPTTFGDSALEDFCRALPGVTEDVKWDDDLVFSVGAKMFAVFSLPEGEPFSFKVDPDLFPALSQQEGIRPAPYLARHSWVLVSRRDLLPPETVRGFLQESYNLVAGKLSKKLRKSLGIEILG
jgi:predicted DNA-binding protein (MmcQ/YjbR family)